MAANTKIEWADSTWSPWIGCQKVSQGCQFCYAQRDFTRKPRWANTWGPPETSHRIRTSESYWQKPLAWNKQAWMQCDACGWRGPEGNLVQSSQPHRPCVCPDCLHGYRLRRTRQRAFPSLCDIFEDNPQVKEWRDDFWRLAEQTPNIDWLITTKRPENIEGMVLDEWCPWNYSLPNHRRFPTNIWLGISAENQDEFERRWCVLESIAHTFYPSILFLSLEPLLGSIDLEICLYECNVGDEEHDIWLRTADWIIVGGESGPRARPMDPAWAKSIRDQCTEAEVPFHFKQWGEWLPLTEARQSKDDRQKMSCVVERLDKGVTKRVHHWGNGDYSCKIGKDAAGRLLDGQEWNQMPEVAR